MFSETQFMYLNPGGKERRNASPTHTHLVLGRRPAGVPQWGPTVRPVPAASCPPRPCSSRAAARAARSISAASSSRWTSASSASPS